MTKIIAENGRELKPHDGCTEWSVCGKCGTLIDWVNDVMFGPNSGRDRDDTTCPHCGHDDTAYLYAVSAQTSEKVYVVKDASGEYIRGRINDDGDMVPFGRTPASNEACEFSTREEAQAACDRTTDRVLSRDPE